MFVLQQLGNFVSGYKASLADPDSCIRFVEARGLAAVVGTPINAIPAVLHRVLQTSVGI